MSTLFHLLLRFYDPESGAISLDGVEVRDADPRDVRRRIALVPQEPVIFATNARENIRFGRPEASDVETQQAAVLAHATKFIDRQPFLAERHVRFGSPAPMRRCLRSPAAAPSQNQPSPPYVSVPPTLQNDHAFGKVDVRIHDCFCSTFGQRLPFEAKGAPC